jgi:hypothetical protein
MDHHVSSPARYRLEDRLLFIMVPMFFAFPVIMAIADHYHLLHHLSGVLAVVCAALASVPFIAATVIFGLYLAEEKDEFQKAVLTSSLLWGIGATFAVTTFWGCMEQFDRAPPMPIWWVQIVFGIVFVIAAAANRWRYR